LFPRQKSLPCFFDERHNLVVDTGAKKPENYQRFFSGIPEEYRDFITGAGIELIIA
jgi:hypothetical protein